MNKVDARRVVEKRLAEITDDEYELLSAQVTERVMKFFEEYFIHNTVKSALIYTAVPKWREVPLDQLALHCPSVAFSYVLATINAPMPKEKYDVIFMPLFGFNYKGYRLGHGGGWYDKFLVTQSQALIVGVGMHAGKIDFEAEPHDQRLDFIITEKEVIRS